jgi:hypothetical protein
MDEEARKLQGRILYRFDSKCEWEEEYISDEGEWKEVNTIQKQQPIPRIWSRKWFIGSTCHCPSIFFYGTNGMHNKQLILES